MELTLGLRIATDTSSFGGLGIVFATKTLRVLIADGHAPTRASLRRVLTDDGRFEVCAEIGDAAGAVAAAVRECPDVCVLDIKLPGGGLSAAWEISARLPRVKLVMLTGPTRAATCSPRFARGLKGTC